METAAIRLGWPHKQESYSSAAMSVLWGLSLIPPIESSGNPNEDGFSYLPAFWATIICLRRTSPPCRRRHQPRPPHSARPFRTLYWRGDAPYRGGILDIPTYRQFDELEIHVEKGPTPVV